MGQPNARSSVLLVVVLVSLLGGAYMVGRLSTGPPANAVGSPAGRVGFEPAAIDLGDQLWDTLLPVELTFVNQGTSAVTVQSVLSSCDCVLLDAESYEQRTVTVGEALTVPLTLDTGRYPGQKHRAIELTAVSGEKYSAVLSLSVHGSWSLTPDSLDFGEVLLGDPQAPDVEGTLTFVSETDELVGEPEVDVSWLRCYPTRRSESTTDILVRVSKNELPPGVSTAHIVFRTTSSIRPDTAVYVRVKAVAALVATPARVFLVADERRHVRFADREGVPVRIARAESSSDAVVASVVGDGDQVEVVVKPGVVPVGATIVRVQDELGRTGTVVVSAF